MLKAAFIILSTSYFAWFIERNERSVIYPFDKTYSTPVAAGEPRLSETRLATSDGESLVVWSAQPKSGRALVVYFPGNAGTLAGRAPKFSALLDRGFGLIAVAYRGSSGSTGRPSEDHLTADAAALLAHVPALLDGSDPGPIVLYGESLGTALSIRLAAGGMADAVVLEAPFTSMGDLLSVQFPTDDLKQYLTQIWDSTLHISDVTQPLLVLHGTKDRLVPIAQGQSLFDAAGSEDKTMIALDGIGHNGLWTVEAQRALYAFLDRAQPTSR